MNKFLEFYKANNSKRYNNLHRLAPFMEYSLKKQTKTTLDLKLGAYLRLSDTQNR